MKESISKLLGFSDPEIQEILKAEVSSSQDGAKPTKEESKTGLEIQIN